MSSPLSTIRRIILWDYERATWQYDLLVALIVGTVLLTPGSFFGDRDRPMKHTNRPELKAVATSGSARAGDQPGEAAKTAMRNTGTEAGSHALEVPVEKLNFFLQTQGRADELQSNEKGALSLYLHDELKREVTLERYEVRLNSGGEPVSYRIWFR
jgi:hypothetical protein